MSFRSFPRLPELTGLALILAAASLVASDSAFEVERRNDIVFASPDGVDLLLDLYLPVGVENSPLVVHIHGGGWKNGDRSRCRLSWLPKHGFALASIEYRLSQEALFPAQIEDCKGALRWLRANSEKYGYDASKVVVSGTSAGGHLAGLMGTSGDVDDLEGTTGGNLDQSSQVQGAIPYYGAHDFVSRSQNQPSKTDEPNGGVYQLLGGPVQENLEAARLASPVTYITENDPPFLILHGENDPTVFLDQSEILHARLEEAGVSSQLIVEKGAKHGWPVNEAEKQAVLAFLKQVYSGD
ncbi:MAG: alpha/beta hydrolase [Verrucomicrobiota bacterium]